MTTQTLSNQQITLLLESWLNDTPAILQENNNQFIKILYDKGRFKELSYDKGILQPLLMAQPQAIPTDSTGAGMITQNSNDISKVGKWGWAKMPLQVVVSQEDLLASYNENSISKALDVIGLSVTTAYNSMWNSVSAQLFGDGTGTLGLACDGLGNAVSNTPSLGIYGGIDSALVPQWRNKAYNTLDSTSSMPNAGDPFSPSNIQPRLTWLQNQLNLNGMYPDLIIMGNTLFNMFNQSMTPTRVFTDTRGEAGFMQKSLSLNDIPVINVEGLQRDADLSPAYTGIGENVIYMLNTKAWTFVYANAKRTTSNVENHKPEGTNISLGNIIRPVVSHDSNTWLTKMKDNLNFFGQFVMQYNLICTDRQTQGVLFQETI